MTEAAVFDREAEKAALDLWFETVSFETEPEGLPDLEPEDDDEDDDEETVLAHPGHSDQKIHGHRGVGDAVKELTGGDLQSATGMTTVKASDIAIGDSMAVSGGHTGVVTNITYDAVSGPAVIHKVSVLNTTTGATHTKMIHAGENVHVIKPQITTAPPDYGDKKLMSAVNVGDTIVHPGHGLDMTVSTIEPTPNGGTHVLVKGTYSDGAPAIFYHGKGSSFGDDPVTVLKSSTPVIVKTSAADLKAGDVIYDQNTGAAVFKVDGVDTGRNGNLDVTDLKTNKPMSVPYDTVKTSVYDVTPAHPKSISTSPAGAPSGKQLTSPQFPGGKVAKQHTPLSEVKPGMIISDTSANKINNANGKHKFIEVVEVKPGADSPKTTTFIGKNGEKYVVQNNHSVSTWDLAPLGHGFEGSTTTAPTLGGTKQGDQLVVGDVVKGQLGDLHITSVSSTGHVTFTPANDPAGLGSFTLPADSKLKWDVVSHGQAPASGITTKAIGDLKVGDKFEHGGKTYTVDSEPFKMTGKSHALVKDSEGNLISTNSLGIGQEVEILGGSGSAAGPKLGTGGSVPTVSKSIAALHAGDKFDHNGKTYTVVSAEKGVSGYYKAKVIDEDGVLTTTHDLKLSGASASASLSGKAVNVHAAPTTVILGPVTVSSLQNGDTFDHGGKTYTVTDAYTLHSGNSAALLHDDQGNVVTTHDLGLSGGDNDASGGTVMLHAVGPKSGDLIPTHAELLDKGQTGGGFASKGSSTGTTVVKPVKKLTYPEMSAELKSYGYKSGPGGNIPKLVSERRALIAKERASRGGTAGTSTSTGNVAKGGLIAHSPHTPQGKLTDVDAAGFGTRFKGDTPGTQPYSTSGEHGVALKNLAYGKLPHDVYQAHGSYTGGGYGSMNRDLRGQSPSSSARTQSKALMKAYDSEPPAVSFDRDIFLYRGITGSAGNPHESAPPGSVFVDKGFVSTSHARGTSFGGTKVRFKVPAGQRMIAGTNYENEYILPPGTTYRKIGVHLDTQTGNTWQDFELVYPN